MLFRIINNTIEDFLYWLTALTAFFFFVVVIAGVLSRYVFLTPITWSIELGRLLFLWSCFLAAAITYRKKAHIAISLITDKLPIKLQRWLEIIRQLLVIAFMGLITIAAIQTISLLWFSGLPVLQISQAWLYIPVPIAATSILLFSLEELSIILLKNQSN